MHADNSITVFIAIDVFDLISPYQILSAFNNELVSGACASLYVTIFQVIVIN